MSIKVMSLVWGYYPRGGGELLLALGLADHSHDDGTRIFPSVCYLAKKTRQSERAVQYQLRAMEGRQWLEKVSGGTGGRGQATEYRINPAWMRDPENFAPFIRAQNHAAKGADNNGKGCKVFAPQPQESLLPTTTTPPAVLGVDGGDESPKWVVVVPPFFKESQQQAVMAMLQHCPIAARQDVLDEVAGIAAKGFLRGDGLGLLSKLVKEAIQGRFVPNHALAYRQRQFCSAEQPEAEPAKRAPADRTVARRHLGEIVAQLAGPRSNTRHEAPASEEDDHE